MKTDNELIAEFMDGTVFDESGQCTNPERKYSWRPGVYDPLRVEHLQYDTSWSWLMPVVEKIEALGYDIDICGNNCIVSEGTPQGDGGKHFRAMIDVDKASKMESVYDAVVEFINWYNSQNQ